MLFWVFVLGVVFVPEGHLGNSPPVHWWVAVPNCLGSAEGTADCYLQNCDLNGLCEFQFSRSFHKRCNLETSAVPPGLATCFVPYPPINRRAINHNIPTGCFTIWGSLRGRVHPPLSSARLIKALRQGKILWPAQSLKPPSPQ